jgi:hypothetical protein
LSSACLPVSSQFVPGTTSLPIIYIYQSISFFHTDIICLQHYTKNQCYLHPAHMCECFCPTRIDCLISRRKALEKLDTRQAPLRKLESGIGFIVQVGGLHPV